MVYLLKQEARNGSYYKVGYTSNLNIRLKAYYCHNANVQLLETIKTYSKTKHQLETLIHSEIVQQGYEFKKHNTTMTEWFFVPLDNEYEFETKGLSQFISCKNRSINKF